MAAFLHTGEDTKDYGAGDVSRHIIAVDAPTAQAYYDKKFIKAFIHMIENPDDKGLMSTHLFYDLPDSQSILSGGHAWEERIRNSVKTGGFWSKDTSVIHTALQKGLVSKLPEGYLKFISYGGGDINAFQGNEMQIMTAVFNGRSEDFVDFCAVDILERYATTCAYAARNKYKLRSHAVTGDFIYNGSLAIPDTKGTPIVMIFGGPFENTPYIKDGRSPEDTTALAWAKLNVQHGHGAIVLKTFDTDQNPDLVNGPYSPSKPFEAFLLSAFARAVEHRVIEDANYDIFAHWKIVSNFNNELKSIELAAQCKDDHSVKIDGRDRFFTKGESRVITLSHKWDEARNVALAKRAGFDVEVIREEGNPNGLMIAKVVRKPDADLMVWMPRPDKAA